MSISAKCKKLKDMLSEKFHWNIYVADHRFISMTKKDTDGEVIWDQSTLTPTGTVYHDWDFSINKTSSGEFKVLLGAIDRKVTATCTQKSSECAHAWWVPECTHVLLPALSWEEFELLYQIGKQFMDEQPTRVMNPRTRG